MSWENKIFNWNYNSDWCIGLNFLDYSKLTANEKKEKQMSYKIGDKIRLKGHPEMGICTIISIDENGLMCARNGLHNRGSYFLNFYEDSILKESPKFNIGDKVKVVLQPNCKFLSRCAGSDRIGKIGKIIGIPGKCEYEDFNECYRVKFSEQLGDTNYIVPEELELVESKTSDKKKTELKKKEIKCINRIIKMNKNDSIKITTESGVFLAELYFYDGRLTIQTRLSKRVKSSIK